jgi:AcrR family transcriptional regulator
MPPVAPAARNEPRRTDSRLTKERLIESVGLWVAQHATAPLRLADLAAVSGVSVATAYRHFASIDDVVRAYVLLLPEQAAQRFAKSDRLQLSARERFHQWNRAWVRASLDQGSVAVHLRSPRGFLERRAEREPTVTFVCDWVEPLLQPLVDDLIPALVVWNAVSDPREVLDLHNAQRWSQERVARFITERTLA